MAFYKYDVSGHAANPSLFLALGGLNLEYNISKSFAIGGELQYRYYAKNDMGYYPNYQPVGFSDAALTSLSLRYKINTDGHKKHVRNIDALEYVPLDGDNDGVSDLLDKCPGSPSGVTVDSIGCPVDTDADGVADYLDKCPGTPIGVMVNVQGCPEEVATLPPLPIVVGVNNFKIGSAVIKPTFVPILNSLVDYLKVNQNVVIDLQSNTDSTGGGDMNQRLLNSVGFNFFLS